MGCAAAVGTSVSATASTVTIDPSSEASVLAAYKSIYVPAMTDTVGWTGSVDSCTPGTTSAQSQQYSLDIINFDRALAGLDPVTLDSTLNSDAQAGALIMAANDNLSHDVPTSWKCYSPQGSSAAASSDLFLGESGAQAIDGYMVDPGSNNTEAGHRRWILYPPATTMGTGSTNNSNDLYVFGGRATAGQYKDPAWVSWPTTGYFPAPLEPNGRWSLSGSAEHSYDFSKATVTVTGPSGKSLPVTVNTPANGYGSDTIVFQVGGITAPGGSAAAYTVSVKNIKEGSTTTSHSYTVRMFNPVTLAVSKASALTGYTRVGQVLHAALPAFSPAASSDSFQWYRNGVAIAHATYSVHTLTASDLGKRIQVKVTGARSGYGSISSVSPASAVITKAVTPLDSAAPKLSGVARVGHVLTASTGTWTPGTVTFTYQWYRSGKAITGATGATHLLTIHDYRKTIWVKVTAHAPGYSPHAILLKGKKTA